MATVRALRVWGVWEPVTQSRDESDDSRNTRWQLLTWAMFLPLLGLAIAGFVIARRRGLVLMPIVVLVVAITVSAALTYGKQRLRVVAEPEIAVLASIALLNRTSAGRAIAARRSSAPSRG